MLSSSKRQHAAAGRQVSIDFSAVADVPADCALRVVGSFEALGCWCPGRGAEMMRSKDPSRWVAAVRMPRSDCVFEYKFVIVEPSGVVIWEDRPNRRIIPSGDLKACSMTPRIRWPADHRRSSAPGERHVEMRFEAWCRKTAPGDTVVVTGSVAALGNWDPAAGFALSTSSSAFPLWTGALRLPLSSAVEWKVVILNPSGCPDWEENSNRSLELPAGEDGERWKVRVHFGGACSEPEPWQPLDNVPAEVLETGPSCTAVLRKSSPERYRSASASNLCAALSTVDQMDFRSSKQQTHDVELQMLTLRLDVPCSEADAAAAVVEVVFEDSSRYQLLRSSPDLLWTLGFPDDRPQPALHHFHFLVNGVRTLSSSHAKIGDSNVMLCNERVRKCIASGTPERHTYIEKCVSAPGIESSQFPPRIKKPYSFASNLTMLKEHGEVDPLNASRRSNFKPDVFAGLHDYELKLHLDGIMLPQVSRTPGSKQSLCLWSGGMKLKKERGICEDAFFTSSEALGVADGVGCMVQFGAYGVNAAAYAAELMELAAGAMETSDTVDRTAGKQALAAVAEAETRAQTYGAATITVLAVEDDTLGVANLGDSGFMLLRRGLHGMCVVERTIEQQHSWNCPYQLTRLPPALAAKFPKLVLDSAGDAAVKECAAEVGDLVLLFTDGLRDNLHDHEILQIVDRTLSPAFGELLGLSNRSTPPDTVARALAFAAKERSLDPSARVPFGEYSRRHGYECSGGKQDDITVVAAWVLSKPALVKHDDEISTALRQPLSTSREINMCPGSAEETESDPSVEHKQDDRVTAATCESTSSASAATELDRSSGGLTACHCMAEASCVNPSQNASASVTAAKPCDDAIEDNEHSGCSESRASSGSGSESEDTSADSWSVPDFRESPSSETSVEGRPSGACVSEQASVGKALTDTCCSPNGNGGIKVDCAESMPRCPPLPMTVKEAREALLQRNPQCYKIERWKVGGMNREQFDFVPDEVPAAIAAWSQDSLFTALEPHRYRREKYRPEREPLSRRPVAGK